MTIGISCSTPEFSHSYGDILKKNGTEVLFISPPASDNSENILNKIGGLLLTGGPDVHPSYYGTDVLEIKGDEQLGDGYPNYNQPRDELEIDLLIKALDRGIPILGICRGMQLMNVALGGSLLQTVDGHRDTNDDLGETKSAFHRIFISPGSRLASTVGSGGFVRVNSRHGQGIREFNKSPDLMGSAWALDDGLIEALESPHHEWVLGVQFHPERRREIPPHFDKLFQNLVDRSISTR